MRPLGDVSRVLMSAAAEQPGTVRQLAERTQVGYGAAKYTASRLLDRGQLVRLTDERPVVLGAPAMAPCGDALADALDDQMQSLDCLERSFWGSGPSAYTLAETGDAAAFSDL